MELGVSWRRERRTSVHRGQSDEWCWGLVSLDHPILHSFCPGGKQSSQSYMQKRSSFSVTPHKQLHFCDAQPGASTLHWQGVKIHLGEKKALFQFYHAHFLACKAKKKSAFFSGNFLTSSSCLLHLVAASSGVRNTRLN